MPIEEAFLAELEKAAGGVATGLPRPERELARKTLTLIQMIRAERNMTIGGVDEYAELSSAAVDWLRGTKK